MGYLRGDPSEGRDLLIVGQPFMSLYKTTLLAANNAKEQGHDYDINRRRDEEVLDPLLEVIPR